MPFIYLTAAGRDLPAAVQERVGTCLEHGLHCLIQTVGVHAVAGVEEFGVRDRDEVVRAAAADQLAGDACLRDARADQLAETAEQVVDLRRDGADELTLVIRLKDEFQWGWSVDYEGNNLVIEVRHRPKSLNIKDLTIGLDAGHGGKYPGAVSPSGLTEKEVNLDIVLKAADMLRKMGAKVVLTRDSDQGPSMTERKKTWLEGGVDLAVSVHNNASGNPLIPMGNSCYYKHISNRALANALHQSMLKMKLADFGLTGNFNFSLNGPTEYPNALVEVLFMSSLPEEELLADPAYRTRLARGVVDGILDYLAQVRKSVK